MTISKTHKGPLAGIRVLDFTRVVAGPYCTMMLGDFGAEIIKVEDPNGGDELRSLGPPFIGTESIFFLSVNRNKKSISLNLKDAESIKAIKELILSVDVLIENFRPGVMKRLGLSYESLRRLNPRLIYCSISAFDERSSRYGDRPGYDLLVSGISGLQSITGEPGRTPLRPGINLVDLTAANNAAMGILMAIIERQSSGKGQKINVSLMDGAFALLGQLAAVYLNTGKVPERRVPEDLHSQVVPYGTFLTKDNRYLNVTVPNNKFWASFCKALNRVEWTNDPRFITNAKRISNRGTLIALVAKRFQQETRNKWIDRLLANDVPAGPVNTIDEVVKDGYLDEVGMLVRMQHPTCGDVVLASIPIRLSKTPGKVRLPSPGLGQHNSILKQQKSATKRKPTAD